MKHIIAYLILTCTLSSAQTLIWNEEFNYTSAPDSDVWSYDLGDWGWGNAELQNYTDDPSNVWVNGSNLVITTLRQGNSFTSARIKTLDKLTFKYGTVEARIQTPDLADGLWPAFWTLGNNFPDVGWPECGEIDVMEMGLSSAISAGTINRWVGSAAHWEHAGSHASYGLGKTMPSDINDTFVVYKMVWTPTEIKTYINGQWIWTIGISGADMEEFHEPHFLLLNLAVGGNYTGIGTADGITADFPAEYKIDYIRLYDNGDTVLGGSSTIVPPVQGSNLLVNPGFESSTTGWAPNLAGGSAATSAAYARSGSDSLLINSTGAGQWSSPNIAQTFSASPGDVFNLQGYMLNPAGSPITGNSFGLFKIEFRNSSGKLLDPVVEIGGSANAPWYGAESTPFLTSASATDTWIFGQTQAEAPVGAAEVSFVILNVNDVNGLMYFDDVQAILVGDPILPFTLSSSVAGGNIQISFPSQNGVSYQMAYKSSLTNESWIPIETIIGDGNTNSASYPVSDPVRFYRVLTP